MIETVTINGFASVTLAFLVYLLGAQLTRKVAFLRDFNIPEPVSGGLLVALATMLIYGLLGRAIAFDLAARDYFLLVFFTGIGLNARLSDLARGGVPLAILLVLTIVYVVLQNLVGVAGARLFELPPEFSVLLSSAALIGGHGTVIAWTPRIEELTGGAAGVSELGVAVATIGLVCAALIGGPIAKYLINRHGLTPERPEEENTIGVGFEDEEVETIDHLSFMRVMLWVHVTIAIGISLWEALSYAGVELPPFVPCLLTGIVLGNLIPAVLPRAVEVRRTPTLAMVSDFALGTFLAMSLMSLQLWTLQGMGLVLLVVMGAQVLLSVVFTLFVLFPAMGRGYRAAVLASGFGGVTLGATPTAIANMTAVTKRYGPSPMAFVILPLVSAFFVDIVNSVAIQFFLPL
ncbi:sodium/glutamate symporter [Tropicimonas sediminicola]|uniref:Sodium/glutamate symporter n=1 Tax=Tropicimonas sediminicola TaxID=1031541 RepID=A0A239FPR2_9RHOB|nr:sodium/glutamate symporter [Tropicimonas sediminicola]SNS57904.1 glutamate:Na+ symporter, ESS family [Tropicimonas sediminicola]